MAKDPAPSDEQFSMDAYVEEVIARALTPYRNRFPPDVLEEFAEEIRVFLHTHPLGSRMLSRVQPDERAASGGQPAAGLERDVLAMVPSLKGKIG